MIMFIPDYSLESLDKRRIQLYIKQQTFTAINATANAKVLIQLFPNSKVSNKFASC